MELKEYNYIQTKIIKRYQLISLLSTDIEKFNKICKLFSEYRELKNGYTATKKMLQVVKKEARI